MKFVDKLLVAATFLFIVLGIVGLTIWTHPAAYTQFLAAIGDLGRQLWAGLVLLFFTVLGLGVLGAITFGSVHLRGMLKKQSFTPITEHGMVYQRGNTLQEIYPASVHVARATVRLAANTQIVEADQPDLKALPEPLIARPSMEDVYPLLERNKLQVCLGKSIETGAPFVMNLIEGTHYRIIGGSGFGKSCQAAAMLDMTTKTNDADTMLIALLDLEHKTSRLFENLPHVAQLQVGRKRVDMVATTPDEVGEHFGYLRQELDRRKQMSEYELRRQRFMLIYVEEFLSLKREIDPDLKNKMMDDFTILALRGRKYGLFLLACAQVDYADKQLREAMGQFNVNMSFTVRPKAAAAAGFSSYELLKQNHQAKQRGQFVLETTGCNDLMIAPHFDVKSRLELMERPRSMAVQPAFVDAERSRYEPDENEDERASELSSDRSDRADDVLDLREKNWGKQAIIEKVWGVKKGGSQRYKDAEAEYEMILVDEQIERGA